MALRYEGFVIVSADGMLADASNIMPDTLKFGADQAFFSQRLDEVDLIVHGRHSFEDQPHSSRRKRIVVTRMVTGAGPDRSRPGTTLWNPAYDSFASACRVSGVNEGSVAIIGGPGVFAMFASHYDVFWLSQAHRVYLLSGQGAFPGVPRQSPQSILDRWGLTPQPTIMLDRDDEVTVTPWRRKTTPHPAKSG